VSATDPAEAKIVSVSRDALRADLGALELRLREYLDGKLVQKASVAEVFLLHEKVEAIEAIVRSLQEAGRLAAERVTVAADTLATETERRRMQLADALSSTDRSFTRRERIGTFVVTVVVALATFYFTLHK